MILKHLHDVGNGRSLLTDGDVDAVKSGAVPSVGVVEGSLLVDDGINSDSGLAGLSVTNDKFSLTSADGDLLFKFINKRFNGRYCLLLLYKRL